MMTVLCYCAGSRKKKVS